MTAGIKRKLVSRLISSRLAAALPYAGFSMGVSVVEPRGVPEDFRFNDLRAYILSMRRRMLEGQVSEEAANRAITQAGASALWMDGWVD